MDPLYLKLQQHWLDAVDDASANEPLTCRRAWNLFQRLAAEPIETESTLLVQFGISDFTGQDRFHFSLSRQMESLDPENDEYVQLELLMLHEPAPELEALGDWNLRSSKFISPAAFFEECELNPGVRKLLASGDANWEVEVGLEET